MTTVAGMHAFLKRRSASLAAAVALAMAIAAPTAQAADPAKPAPSGSGASAPCILVDTDFDIDDLMALPQLLSTGRVVGIVTTEGLELAPQSASAITALFGQPGSTNRVPVIVGASYPGTRDLSDWPWLPPLRASMARANGLLTASLTPDPRTPASSAGLPTAVAHLVRGCKTITQVIIGPFSSFTRYSPLIRDRIIRVVMEGKPPRGDSTQPAGKISFNCEYNRAACDLAMVQLRGLHPTWVDVPSGQGASYLPNMAMVQALKPSGLPGSTRAALMADPTTWDPASITDGNTVRMWDVAAATYVLHPGLFAPVGGHVEPTVSPEQLRRLWMVDINRWKPSIPTP